MKRYIILYLYFLRFSFSRAMEFRVDFSFRIFMDVIFYITQFMFFNIIYLHTPILGGWNHDQIMLFVGAFIFVDAFNMTFFANNAWWFPNYINRGDLDYYLTKPVSSFFFIGFREIAANSFVNFLIATGLLTYLLSTTVISLEPYKVIIFILLLLNGGALYYATHLIFLMIVFWTQSPRGFGDLFYTAEKIMQRPDGIFKGYVRRFFLHILPFSLMASYPTRYLISDNSNNILGEILLSSFIIYLLVFVMWKSGLRNYSSASS
jgi:ABC-2 type transport system permease protein